MECVDLNVLGALPTGLLPLTYTAQNIDANDVDHTCLVRLGTSCTNVPSGVNTMGGYLLTLFYSLNYISQVIYERSVKIYIRDKNANTWTDWKPLAFES